MAWGKGTGRHRPRPGQTIRQAHAGSGVKREDAGDKNRRRRAYTPEAVRGVASVGRVAGISQRVLRDGLFSPVLEIGNAECQHLVSGLPGGHGLGLLPEVLGIIGADAFVTFRLPESGNRTPVHTS